MKYKIEYLFDLQMGRTPERKNEKYWNNGVHKWIAISDMPKNQKYIENTAELISDIAVTETKIPIIPPNTVIMSFKLSVGKTAITKMPIYSNEAIMAFKDKHTVELMTDYIYYLLSCQKWGDVVNDAAKGNTLNKAIISQYEINIHSIEEQHKIVNELDKINSVIKLLKKRINLLDELVKSRFVEMFGDTYSNPMNWDRMTFKQAAIRLSDGPFGSNLKSEHYADSGIRVIRLGNIGVGEFIDKDKSYIPSEHYEKLKKYTCRTGEIVIGTLGEPNLRACRIPDYIDIAVNKADCVHFIPNDKILNVTFACQYINCPETLSLASSMVHGQTRTRISSGQIAELPIYLPPLDLQQQFAAFVEQTDKSKFDGGCYGNNME